MWITDWSQIEDEALYIVAPIQMASNNETYLGARMERSRGWEVKRLLKGCYAALPSPTWDGKMTRPQVSSPS